MRAALLMLTLLAGVMIGSPAGAMPSAQAAITSLEPAGMQPAYYYYRRYRPYYRIYRPYAYRRFYYRPRFYPRYYVAPY